MEGIKGLYNQDLINEVKSISGRKCNSEGKYWKLHYDENLIFSYILPNWNDIHNAYINEIYAMLCLHIKKVI